MLFLLGSSWVGMFGANRVLASGDEGYPGFVPRCEKWPIRSGMSAMDKRD